MLTNTTPYLNAVLVYGGSKNPQVKTALKNLKPVLEESMEPPMPDKSKFIDGDGKQSKAIEAAIMSVWTEKAKRASKLFSVYEQDL